MHGLLKHVLFNFHVLAEFPGVFMLLISNSISLWSENTLFFDFNSLKFVENCFMVYCDCSVDTWKIRMFCAVGWSVEMSISSSWPMVRFSPPVFLMTFRLVVPSTADNGVWKSPTVTEFVYFSFQVCLFVFTSYILILCIWHTHIWDNHNLPGDWSRYHHVISLCL